jgi:phosphoribosylamine--glycine ligase
MQAVILAGGKGVIIAETVFEALQALSQIMEAKAFGAAGDRVVIEEKLAGREMSYFAFSDGRVNLPMVSACDYKRVNEGDQGPNTGGMGAYSPSDKLTEADLRKKLEEWHTPE